MVCHAGSCCRPLRQQGASGALAQPLGARPADRLAHEVCPLPACPASCGGMGSESQSRAGRCIASGRPFAPLPTAPALTTPPTWAGNAATMRQSCDLAAWERGLPNRHHSWLSCTQTPSSAPVCCAALPARRGPTFPLPTRGCTPAPPPGTSGRSSSQTLALCPPGCAACSRRPTSSPAPTTATCARRTSPEHLLRKPWAGRSPTCLLLSSSKPMMVTAADGTYRARDCVFRGKAELR